MPASALTVGFGSWISSDTGLPGEPAQAGVVRLDPEVLSVRHASRPELDYLGAGLGPLSLAVDGHRHEWQRIDSAVDVDEVESRYRPAGRSDLELVVRHAFRTVWVQRYVLANISADPVRLEDLEIALAPGEDTVGWMMTAGAEAFWLCQPATGWGPVLAATLQFGEVNGYRTGGGWHTGPIDLAAGSRYVVQWVADWYPSTADFQRRRATVLPDRTELVWPQPCEIAGVDAAVVVDPPLSISHEHEQTILIPERPGRFEVELRSSRGTVRCGMTWVQPVADVIGRAAQHLLDGPRTPAGVVRLADSTAGLVLQRALTDRLPDQGEEAADALDCLAAQLLAEADTEFTDLEVDGGPERPARPAARSGLSVFDIALLAGESVRTGDRDYAAAARDAVLDRSAPEPGLGFAATTLSVAELAAGVSVGPILEHLSRLARTSAATSGVNRADSTDWARLELALIIRPHTSELSGEDLGHALALGAALGCGLPGEPMQHPGGLDPTYAAAVLALIPDDRADQLQHRWALRPQGLAERLRRRGLARRASAETLAWLVLSQPTS